METMVVADLAAQELRLKSAAFVERELAAVELAGMGGDGAAVLRRVATDKSLPAEVRVTALRHLPADEDAIEALRTLLADPSPVIRVLALESARRARATVLLPAIEALIPDRAAFWDLDEQLVVGEVAARVRDALASPGA